MGELGRPPDFWLSHEVRTRQRETQKVLHLYRCILYIIYMWYAVCCCMLLVDLCGCWLIQMSGAMEFLHVLVQWWVFPFLPASFPAIIQLARQSSTNHWNMAGNHETRTIKDTSAMFFAADLAQKFWGSSVNNLLLPENAQKLKDPVEGRGDRISCNRLYWTHIRLVCRVFLQCSTDVKCIKHEWLL